MERQIQLLIKKLRQKQGITQKELAKELKVSFQTISKWENGITLPDISYLPILADIFGVSTDVLLGIKPLESEEPWRKFDKCGYWNKHMERTRAWKSFYWNDDYFSFLVKEVWKIHNPVNILDFGCGYGFLAIKLFPLLHSDSTYTGIDLDSNAIEEAHRIFQHMEHRTCFIQEDFYKYKPKKKYDIVIGLYLLSYLQKPNSILQKMKDSLVDGGKLILIDANMEVQQAGYYSCIEKESGLECPDFIPIWKEEKRHKERDYKMGIKLPCFLKEMGLSDIQVRISDKVMIYDSDDKEKEEFHKTFRYVYENTDPFLEGHSHFISRGASYLEAERYVDYFQKTKQYFDLDHSFAVSTSGIYFAWGTKECSNKDKKEVKGEE